MNLTALTCAVALIGCAPAVAPTPCQEDAPCFNWRTMGNHHRAIVTIGGKHLIVSPVRFDRLNRTFHINWELTPKLKGDRAHFNAQDY